MRWAHRIAVMSQSLIFREKEESAGSRGRGGGGGGSRIDRRRWGPTPRRLREGRTVSGYTRVEPRERDIFRDSIHSLLPCIHISPYGGFRGKKDGSRYTFNDFGAVLAGSTVPPGSRCLVHLGPRTHAQRSFSPTPVCTITTPTFPDVSSPFVFSPFRSLARFRSTRLFNPR